jgi:hypothetical protein
MAWRHNWTSYNDHILASIIIKIVITYSSLSNCFCFWRQPHIKKHERRSEKSGTYVLSVWWSSRCRIITAAHKICTTITRRYPLNNTSFPLPHVGVSFSCQKNIASAIPLLLIFRFIFQDFSIIYTFFSISVAPASVLCAFKRIHFHNFCYQTLKHEPKMFRGKTTSKKQKSSANLIYYC